MKNRLFLIIALTAILVGIGWLGTSRRSAPNSETPAADLVSETRAGVEVAFHPNQSKPSRSPQIEPNLDFHEPLQQTIQQSLTPSQWDNRGINYFTALAPGQAPWVNSKKFAITGIVSITGTLPSERPLPLDPICAKASEEMDPGVIPTTRFYVSDEGGLGDVLVTLVDMDGHSTGVNAAQHVIDQRACQFTPYVSACQTGQPIKITNSDPTLHSIIATSTVPGNPQFTKAQLPDAAPLHFVVEQPEEFIRFKCDVHPWMFTYISVIDHPYFDVTSPKGGFNIRDLPPGTYQIKARHRKIGELISEVEITSNDVEVNFAFTLD